MPTPCWVGDEVFYQILPERFAKTIGLRNLQHCNPGIPNQLFTVIRVANLFGIIENLEYLKSLGVNAIYLNPIFQGPHTTAIIRMTICKWIPCLVEIKHFASLWTVSCAWV